MSHLYWRHEAHLKRNKFCYRSLVMLGGSMIVTFSAASFPSFEVACVGRTRRPIMGQTRHFITDGLNGPTLTFFHAS